MTDFNIVSNWVDCEDATISITFKDDDIVVNNLPYYIIHDQEFINEMGKIHKRLFGTIDEYTYKQIQRDQDVDYLRKIL